MIQTLKKFALPILIILGAIATFQTARYADVSFYQLPHTGAVKPNAMSTDVPTYKIHKVVSDITPTVHSATGVTLNNGNLLSMWYGGSREGHTDVALYSAVFDQNIQSWDKHQKVLDRYDASDSLNRYIKKIGNPILVKHPQGPIVLIYVSVSLAGWATSHLNMAVSYDEGQTWHDSIRLVAQPAKDTET